MLLLIQREIDLEEGNWGDTVHKEGLMIDNWSTEILEQKQKYMKIVTRSNRESSIELHHSRNQFPQEIEYWVICSAKIQIPYPIESFDELQKSPNVVVCLT